MSGPSARPWSPSTRRPGTGAVRSASVQSSWAVGWGLAAIVYTLDFRFLDEGTAWRVMFWTGALPALLVLWVRRRVHDAPETAEQRRRSDRRGSFAAIFAPATTDGRPGMLRTTFFAVLLSTGVQGGYYTLATWVPTYLKSERGLSVVNTGGYLAFLISGAFIGYLTGGYLTDLLGRKRKSCSSPSCPRLPSWRTRTSPADADTALLVLGFPLGFCMSAIFSGFGSYLSELYPTAIRGTGQGFAYNTGRAVGAAFPTLVGFLADSWGVGGALVFGALASSHIRRGRLVRRVRLVRLVRRGTGPCTGGRRRPCAHL